MPTAAQVAANRENAKGPRTLSEETKESLRTRALKHGLTSKLDTNAVLRGENKQEFETILNALLSDATLGTAQEILLIKMQAESFWKLQRAGRMEAGAMEISLVMVQMKNLVDKDLTEEYIAVGHATAIREQGAWFETLRRYSTTAERTFFRATRELAMIRKAGPQEQIGYVPQTPEPIQTKDAKKDNTPEVTPEPAPEIGCVSQTAPPAARPEHPGTKPRRELGGLSRIAFIEKLENMSQAEAFAFFDTLA
jgi:hypothetical protein